MPTQHSRVFQPNSFSMLRNLFSICALTLLGSVTAFGQVTVGIKGSAQLAKETFAGSGQSITADNIVGFQAGLILKAPVSDQFSIRPQLLYSVKGLKLSSNVLGTGNEAKATINYLEVPIQLAYAFEAGEGNIVIGAGPYLAYALNGTGTTTTNGKTTTESLDFSSSDAQKRFDYGLTVSAGYELNSGLGLSFYYSPGLANLSSSSSSSILTTKNTAIGISISYFFGGN